MGACCVRNGKKSVGTAQLVTNSEQSCVLWDPLSTAAGSDSLPMIQERTVEKMPGCVTNAHAGVPRLGDRRSAKGAAAFLAIQPMASRLRVREHYPAVGNSRCHNAPVFGGRVSAARANRQNRCVSR